MIETELKITLDAEGLARLRRHPELARLRRAPRRTRDAGVGLLRHRRARARRRRDRAPAPAGRAALGADGQAARPTGAGERALRNRESERPAPGGRLVLAGPDPEGRWRRCARRRTARRWSPVFETRVRRVERAAGGAWRRRGGAGARRGRDRRRGGQRADPRGGAGAVVRRGRRGLRAGAAAFPQRAGALRLGEQGRARLPAGQDGRGRGAGRAAQRRRAGVRCRGDGRDGGPRRASATASAQIAANMAVVADSAALEGPHQLRVGLRRLRTAFAVFGPSLGEASMKPLSEAAQRLGQVVGELRDADVLMSEVVAGAARSRPRRGGARGAGRGAGGAAGPGAGRGAGGAGGARGAGFLFDLGGVHRGARLAGRRPTSRRARGWRRRSARSRPGILGAAAPQGDEARPQGARARCRGPARAAQGAEEAALHRGHAGAALPRRPDAAPISGRSRSCRTASAA